MANSKEFYRHFQAKSNLQTTLKSKHPQNKHTAVSISLFLTSNTHSNHSHILGKVMIQTQRLTFTICFEIVGPPLKEKTHAGIS